MGFIGSFVVKLIKLLLYLGIFFSLIVLIPNLPPYTTFTRINIESTLPREGALAPNGALNNAQKLYEDKLLGPEAYQLFDGEVYTSLATGEIVKLSSGGHVTFVTKIGQPCTGTVQEDICGRPLGFRIDEKNKVLYIADAYHGIWKVDLKTDKKQLLVSPRVEVEGCQPKLFNDLVLDKEGNLYYTVSSCDFQLKDGVYITLLDPSGRLLQYNAAKNESKVLLDKLWFANGVVVSPDDDFLLISESSHYRVRKYYIKGPKKGKSETFLSGLPGITDNIRTLPDGSGVLLGLYTVFDEENPLITRSLSSVPLVRKFLARLQRLVEIPFEFLNNQFPHVILEDIVYTIGHFKTVSNLTPQKSGLLQVDWNGNIIASYFNTDGTVKHISDGIVYKDMLYLGNPHVQNFVAAVPAPPLLKKAFNVKSKRTVKEDVTSKVEPQLKKDKPKEAEKPTIVKPTTQMPKTTTSKPETKTAPPPPPPKDIEAVTPPKQESKPKPTVPTTSKPPQSKPSTPKPIEIKSTPSPQRTVTKPSTPKIEDKPIQKQTETKQTLPKQTESKPMPPKQTESKPMPPKLAENKPEPPKQAESKPAPQKQAESKPAPSKQADSKPEPPKQAESMSALPKQPKSSPAPPIQVESKPEPPKQAGRKSKEPEQNAKPEQKAKSEAKPSVNRESTESKKSQPTPEEIPIKENIPLDTTKPNKNTLKVIKKEGPTEIPYPGS